MKKPEDMGSPEGWIRSLNISAHGWKVKCNEDDGSFEVFELRPRDACLDDVGKDRERSELKSCTSWTDPTGQSLRLQFYLDACFDPLGGDASVVLAQIHRRNRNCETPELPKDAVLFQLLVKHECLFARVHLQDNDQTARNDAKCFGPITDFHGNWTKVVIEHTLCGENQNINVCVGEPAKCHSFCLSKTQTGWEHYFKYGIYHNKISQRKKANDGQLPVMSVQTVRFKSVQMSNPQKDTV